VPIDEESGYMDVTSGPDSSDVLSTLQLHRIRQKWNVLTATSDTMWVTSPAAGAALDSSAFSSEFAVEGVARGYEGVVSVVAYGTCSSGYAWYDNTGRTVVSALDGESPYAVTVDVSASSPGRVVRFLVSTPGAHPHFAAFGVLDGQEEVTAC